MLDIIIDTREQRPWSFGLDEARVSRGKLDYGDYALQGDSDFAIERKSLDDYCGTVGVESNWRRFKRELDRAHHAGCAFLPIIVEGNWEDFLFRIDELGRCVPPVHSHPGFSPALAIRRHIDLASPDIFGTSLHYASTADAAAVLAFGLLANRAKELAQ